jgi:hypothetical protein
MDVTGPGREIPRENQRIRLNAPMKSALTLGIGPTFINAHLSAATAQTVNTAKNMQRKLRIND